MLAESRAGGVLRSFALNLALVLLLFPCLLPSPFASRVALGLDSQQRHVFRRKLNGVPGWRPQKNAPEWRPKKQLQRGFILSVVPTVRQCVTLAAYVAGVSVASTADGLSRRALPYRLVGREVCDVVSFLPLPLLFIFLSPMSFAYSHFAPRDSFGPGNEATP